MSYYDDLLRGAEGEVALNPETVDSMDMVDSNAITAKLEYEMKLRPALKVLITDTPEGGLVIRWRTR